MSTRATLLKIAVAATDDLPHDTAVIHLRAEAQLSANELIRLHALNSDLLAALKETGLGDGPCQVTGHYDERCSSLPITTRCTACFARAAIKAAEKQSAGEQS